MNWSSEFVELDKSKHDRISFDCGRSELNYFLHTQASRHMEVGISRTMVLPSLDNSHDEKYSICAFYTIVPSSISRETLPSRLSKKLPRYPVPVFLLAQLAVHNNYQGQGLGKITLVKALEYLWEINNYMRAYAIIVDCLDVHAERFYKKFGFDVLTQQNNKVRMYIPMTTVARLFS